MFFRKRRAYYSIKSILICVTTLVLILLVIGINWQEHLAITYFESHGYEIQYDSSISPDFSLSSFATMFKSRTASQVYRIEIKPTSSDNALDSVSELRHLKVFRNLRVLRLAPEITDKVLGTIPRIDSMHELEIFGSNLTGKGLTHLDRLPNLEYLELGCPQCEDNDLTTLNSLSKLRTLKIYSRMNGEWLSSLADLKNLNCLELRGGPNTDEGIAHMAPNPNLKILKLDNLRITGACFLVLPNFQNLHELEIYKCPIFDEHIAELRNALNLQAIVMWDTQITKNSRHAFASIPNLIALDLHNRNLFPSIEWSESLSHLESLLVDGRFVIKEGVQQPPYVPVRSNSVQERPLNNADLND